MSSTKVRNSNDSIHSLVTCMLHMTVSTKTTTPSDSDVWCGGVQDKYLIASRDLLQYFNWYHYSLSDTLRCHQQAVKKIPPLITWWTGAVQTVAMMVWYQSATRAILYEYRYTLHTALLVLILLCMQGAERSGHDHLSIYTWAGLCLIGGIYGIIVSSRVSLTATLIASLNSLIAHVPFEKS